MNSEQTKKNPAKIKQIIRKPFCPESNIITKAHISFCN